MDSRKVKEAVTLYSNTVRKVAFAYTQNVTDADDISQSTFLALLECKKNFTSPDHIKAWLIRTATNKSKNHVNSAWNKKRTELPSEFSNDCPPLPVESIQLVDALRRLKPKYRIPVHLYYYEGYSSTEIAKILHCPSSTVRSHLKRAKEQLKSLIGDNEIDT